MTPYPMLLVDSKLLPASNSLAELLPQGEFVLPRYDGQSIANIPATAAALLGAQIPNSQPLRRDLWSHLGADINTVVLFITDALGYIPFTRVIAAQPNLALAKILQSATFAPLTSVFPSTTTAALTSYWTGRTPIEHGMLGYWLWLREYGLVATMIELSPLGRTDDGYLLRLGMEPEKFVPVPALGEVLSAQGIAVYNVQRKALLETALSRIHRRGVTASIGYHTLSDLCVRLADLLNAKPRERKLVVAYWPFIDSLSHEFGPDAPAIDAEVRTISFCLQDHFLGRLELHSKRNTAFILAADHGHATVPLDRIIYLQNHPGLAERLLLPPTGEPRVPYLYARQGEVTDVKAYLAQHLADAFTVLDSASALGAGLWGVPTAATPTARLRLGDLTLLARGGYTLSSGGPPPTLLGRHGSLTPEEMLVPFVLTRLEQT